jgi:hypothetical protein
MALSNAERQARWRARKQEELATLRQARDAAVAQIEIAPKGSAAAPLRNLARNVTDDDIEQIGDPWERIIELLEVAIVSAEAIDRRSGTVNLYQKRVESATRCMEALWVDIEDVWRAQNGEPEGEPEEDGKDPRVRAAIETHRAAIKRLSPGQKAEFWAALRMVKRTPRQSKAQRWSAAISELLEIQEECASYADSVPDGLRDETREELYRAIADIDLSEIEDAEFP